MVAYWGYGGYVRIFVAKWGYGGYVRRLWQSGDMVAIWECCGFEVLYEYLCKNMFEYALACQSGAHKFREKVEG